ncbi:hypothetical protein [Mesorhizobium sp. 2RAF21]|uniref:hypothetical protein n=1 Tax=Mesorhizobium sp. 2RAF21 TaxID=3232995 RepID=UPI003F96D624
MLRISRKKLHELVWSKPMTEIARIYGIRDQHIAQACDAHDVARPRTGHWQRVEHGKRVETVSLSNAAYPAEEIVIIDRAGGKSSHAA